MAMFRLILNYLFLLEITNDTDPLYDLAKPRIYLGQDSRNT